MSAEHPLPSPSLSAGTVALVGAGPGDPELLTRRAARLLHEADVILHDRLVSDAILNLAGAHSVRIGVGKKGFGPSVPQSEINRLLVAHARAGSRVVRLKAGDPGVFGRLDDEIDACARAGITWFIVPGVTAASAASSALGQSLTRRGRNIGLRLMTGHDAEGFAEHDWRALAQPGQVAAIYMGKRSARFFQGRLIMHDADPATPVSLIENASRPDERIIGTTLARLAADLDEAGLAGPVITLFGLPPRTAERGVLAAREVAS